MHIHYANDAYVIGNGHFFLIRVAQTEINYFLLQREPLLNKHPEQTQDNTTLKSDLRGAPFDDEEHVLPCVKFKERAIKTIKCWNTQDII